MDHKNHRWIIITLETGGTTEVTSIDYTDVRRVEATAKAVGSNLKRSFRLVFRDGSVYDLPDAATVRHAPQEYAELIGQVSQYIRV